MHISYIIIIIYSDTNKDFGLPQGIDIEIFSAPFDQVLFLFT